MPAAAEAGLESFITVTTQVVNVGLTMSHFQWSRTHSDEVIQWSFLYYFMLFPMFFMMVLDVVFYFLGEKNYNKKLYNMVQGDSVFLSFLFAFSQGSEIANYNMDNTFPKWQLALMLGLNLLQIVMREPKAFGQM